MGWTNAENADRLRSAIEEWGAKIGVQGANAFAELDRQMIRLGVPPNMVDILNFAGTIPFEEAYARRIEATIDGKNLPVISREDLIDAKRRRAGLKTSRIYNDLE